MSKRASATERVRDQIDQLFGSERELGEVLEEVGPLGSSLLVQAALDAEVTEWLGRDRFVRGDRDHAGLRNGSQPIAVKTTAGPVTIERPKLRGTDEAFASRLLGSGVTRTHALESMVIAGFVRGLSVRDVEATLAEAPGGAGGALQVDGEPHLRGDQDRVRRLEGARPQRRRVKVIGRLPGERTCLSLVWAVPERASKGRRGLQRSPASLRLIHDLRQQWQSPRYWAASPPSSVSAVKGLLSLLHRPPGLAEQMATDRFNAILLPGAWSASTTPGSTGCARARHRPGCLRGLPCHRASGRGSRQAARECSGAVGRDQPCPTA